MEALDRGVLQALYIMGLKRIHYLFRRVRVKQFKQATNISSIHAGYN